MSSSSAANYNLTPVPAADFKVLWASPVTRDRKTRRFFKNPEVALKIPTIDHKWRTAKQLIIRDWGVLRNLLNILSGEHEAGLRHHELKSMAMSIDLKDMVDDYFIEGASNKVMVGLSIRKASPSSKEIQIVGISNPTTPHNLTAFSTQIVGHVRKRWADEFMSAHYDLERVTGLHGISSQDYPTVTIHTNKGHCLQVIIFDSGSVPHVLVRGRYKWSQYLIQPLPPVKLKGSPHEIPEHLLCITLDNFMQSFDNDWRPHRVIPTKATAWCEWLGRRYDADYQGKTGLILNMNEINRLEHELFLKFFHLPERKKGAQ